MWQCRKNISRFQEESFIQEEMPGLTRPAGSISGFGIARSSSSFDAMSVRARVSKHSRRSSPALPPGFQGVVMKFGGFSRVQCAVFVAAVMAAFFQTNSLADESLGPRAHAVNHHALFASTAAADTNAQWFPDRLDEPTVARPVLASFQPPDPLIPEERPLIPLPSGAWTGLMGILAIVIVTARKALLRFIS
jgi:hypothetical protein